MLRRRSMGVGLALVVSFALSAVFVFAQAAVPSGYNPKVSDEECPQASSGYGYNSSAKPYAQYKDGTQTKVNLYGTKCSETLPDKQLVSGDCRAANTCHADSYT